MARQWLLVSAALLLVLSIADSLHSGARPPNIVLIIADDQGWGDIRSHGNTKIDTPTLDKLASQGARFDRFFVSPVCAPTRASLLTGRYHLRTGVHGVTRGYEVMRSEEVTLAEVLRQAGYATGCFGKWHNGAHFPHHPNGQGFDEFFGFCGGHWNNYFDTRLEHNGQPVATRGFITDVLTDEALKFIRKNKDRPFFCYLACNAPHSPFQVPDKYFARYKERGLDDKTASVYAMVENIDDNIARVLAALDELQLSGDTIVIFLTDNGPNSDRYNGGMLGRKGSVHEGGIRVPFFIRWTGHIPAGKTIPQIAAHIDVMPTLLDLAGVTRPKTVALDGVSLAPLLRGKTQDWPERMIFSHQAKGGEMNTFPGSVRTQQYRLVNPGKKWELYDMETDPGQKTNIADKNSEVVSKLKSAYQSWFQEVTRSGFERLPIPIGHAERKLVELPAPECYLEGEVHYKGQAGYANDWLTGWANTKDRIWWDVDIVKAGKYEVTLLYTCPEKQTGSRIRVEIQDQVRIAQLTQAHDPQPIPSPDRVARGEVYEKVWGELVAGQVDLKPGPTQLRLQAAEIPGAAVMELRAVQVRKVD